MCGIFGYVGLSPSSDRLKRMASVSTHRGPDDGDFFENETAGIGFRRLSIIDVSGGRQPIFNEDRSALVVGNGEIYNHATLRDRLQKKGHKFSTASDIEVILHLYEDLGDDCVHELRGMFAFAIYDIKKKRLVVIRDRLGIKPAYYWEENGKIIFASEIKSILECPEVVRRPNLSVVDQYLSLRYAPGPETMFAGVRKLSAGHKLVWENHKTHLERYWAPASQSLAYEPDDFYRERFRELFEESVKMRLMSEVPLGAFLSGGIDSSAIVATMSRLVSKPVKTFSVGFEWQGDELPAAREVARAMGTDHHEIICKPQDLSLLPKIVWHLDEPIGDAIVVPMFLLSQFAKKEVSVVLTGEGADETLAGYLPHKTMYWARNMPRALRDRVFHPLAKIMPSEMLNLAFSYPGELGQRGKQKVLGYLDLAKAGKTREEYYFLISLFGAGEKNELYTNELRPFIHHFTQNGDTVDAKGAEYLNQILALQYESWLPDDILMKQDKMTMANSLEGRVPFLDHKLFEFLQQTPPHLKLKGLQDKALLRDYVKGVAPGAVFRRAKKPFYIPIDQYFDKGPLKEILETCLSEKSVKKRGYFQWAHVQNLRKSMSHKDFLVGKQVLSLVMLELWHRIFIDQEPGWV